MLLLYFYRHLRTCLLILERGEGRMRETERNINIREKRRWDTSRMSPNWRLNPQPRHVPYPGIKRVTFQFMG